ncbi:MAG: Wzz/FepE/Etk N-terminal domain-containing protein [Thermoleophilia bacterium]
MRTIDLYRTLWRYRFLIVGLTAALVAVTWFVTSRQQDEYEATTLVRIQQEIRDPTEAFGSLETGKRLAQVYAKIVATDAIRERVAETAGIPVDQVHLSASPVDDLDLLAITATSTDPRRAANAANAAPASLVAFIQDTGTIREQVITVSDAQVPDSPSAPRPKRNIAIALILGLILNSAFALAIAPLSDRLPDPEELESLTGYPVLATIPKLTRREARPTSGAGPSTRAPDEQPRQERPPPQKRNVRAVR